MFPVIYVPYLREETSESSEDEESASLTSTDSSTSDDSTSSVDATSAGFFAVTASSASPVRAVYLTSSMPSTSPILGIIPGPSTSSMPQMIPVQTLLVHPMPPGHPEATVQPEATVHSEATVHPETTVYSETTVYPEVTVYPKATVYPEAMAHPEASVPSTSCGIQENCDDFRFEAARRLSFRNWPVPYIKPDDLVTAGFYYTGIKDTVKCFVCQMEASDWSLAHTPMQVHHLWSPQCRFVRNENCGNVPIGADPDKVLGTKRKTIRICCPYGLQYPLLFSHDHQLLRHVRNPSALELSRLGLTKVKKAEHLKFGSYESRLNTFANWPKLMIQSEQLAEAGFYYTGIDDFTICYHCGLRTGNWIPEEDPWKRHAISSPTCCYVLIVRGCEYVNNVTGQELYETFTEAPIQATVGDHEGSDNENDANEMSLAEKVAALEEKNRALKKAGLCKICLEREATITFLPCGHLVTCDYCSPAFAQCIICRRKIKAVVRTFLV